MTIRMGTLINEYLVDFPQIPQINADFLFIYAKISVIPACVWQEREISF